ncbi:MAG TPA: hypothetical protein VMI31_08245 [Fimbriimonadaceae bacterium]|nr:hypothetical protein [Fimbriimonadaceae bacterium]
MIILPFLSAALFVVQGQGSKSNYGQIVQHPNPNNGYEDYLRASDIAQGYQCATLISWYPNESAQLLASKHEMTDPAGNVASDWTPEDEAMLALSKQLDQLGYLGVRKRLSDQFGGVVSLVKTGNQKAVWDPRTQLDASTVFPEFAGFKSVAKLIAEDSYVRFSEGDSRDGTDDLLQGYTFAEKIGGHNLISELVSIACRSIMLAEFETELPRLSDADAKEIIKYTDSALTDSGGLARAWKSEREQTLANIPVIFEHPDVFSGDDLPAGFQDFLTKMSGGDRQAAANAIAQGYGSFFDKLEARLGGDESTWAKADPDSTLPPMPKSVNSVQDVTDVMLNMMLPTFDPSVTAELRSRAQLRLLGLHARIIDFRWKNGRLPKTLAEAVPKKLLFDPMSGGEFEYRITDDGGYKLHSNGVKGSGPIELKYKRPPGQSSSGDDQGIPPPLPGPISVPAS